MKTLSRFVVKFTSLIVAVLSCFDRVIFKGHLPISNAAALEAFVDGCGRVGVKDYAAFSSFLFGFPFRLPSSGSIFDCKYD